MDEDDRTPPVELREDWIQPKIAGTAPVAVRPEDDTIRLGRVAALGHPRQWVLHVWRRGGMV